MIILLHDYQFITECCWSLYPIMMIKHKKLLKEVMTWYWITWKWKMFYVIGRNCWQDMQNYYNLNQKKTRVWLRELCECFVKRVWCLSEQHVMDHSTFTARLLHPGSTLSATLLIAYIRFCITWIKEVILEIYDRNTKIFVRFEALRTVCDDSSLLGHRAMAAGK